MGGGGGGGGGGGRRVLSMDKYRSQVIMDSVYLFFLFAVRLHHSVH